MSRVVRARLSYLVTNRQGAASRSDSFALVDGPFAVPLWSRVRNVPGDPAGDFATRYFSAVSIAATSSVVEPMNDARSRPQFPH
jgi:hypothetical protein